MTAASHTIRQLNDTVINQIAAGEVIERPASVVKELVENALDAGSTRIEVATAGGGLSLLRVTDNGGGIEHDELPLAVSRHCTSKLTDDIHDIRSLGFRGEALPSIGSVARLSLRSRPEGADSAAEIAVEGGRVSPVRPVAANRGTTVEVRDLFFATPARLKFMKSERAETAAITEVVKRMALAFPEVRFTLTGSDRNTLELPAVPADGEGLLRRIAQVMGKDFSENTLPIEAEREGVALSGHVSIPSFSRGNAMLQYFYVNGRPVRDKLLTGAIRGAYMDVLPRDRHAVVALFISLDPALVDVNVHPAKADVRFRDPGLVRGLIVGAIRHALEISGMRASTSGADAMLAAFRQPEHAAPGGLSGGGVETGGGSAHYRYTPPPRPAQDWRLDTSPTRPLDMTGSASIAGAAPAADGFSAPAQSAFDVGAGLSADARAGEVEAAPELMRSPLGAARAQVHENYIVAQTEDSLVIVDQHAAHERLVYEALKEALHSRALPAQMLLLPEIVDMPEEDADRVAAHAEFLARFGLGLERFGPGAIAVRETPSMLGKVDVPQLVRDLADEIAENDTADTLKERIDHIAATMACHGSVRSGRRLRAEEMNALLRQMEATPGSGTCNHGRPTYIELKLTDIERLFGRR
ncbi:DNA mismatch repair endonuclease MutL [Nitratireductor aquimarinus]|uniref:DNA mismatch repair endonuclease MutL n=1 Tax=Nitratireductor TaxID=245876 RepID=UPI0019D3CECC|nr:MULTISPECIES: DNA mismatch repair endonuclease MutL [Nitratireductor]MBN7776029.1 DNA mismatch repair endonuclease MutL [Nitratireductor pacificus]MBN7780693.1 DNA mismatch repair endonuclease MutL [Nitratireductor pacificus]MBN7789499.1 DNA mismatch repair endonuclease MutL [Nitratireductor aquimarinus]MBY6098777.1 DNA mismatch repair endonuclease MutL [Nitratireductor aquimarinus]